jgi:cytochrome c oxidase subunit 3
MNAPDSVAIEQHRDYAGSKMGMWLFLLTELILFGGLFLLYSVYRSTYRADFHNAAGELNAFAGTLNTLVLLTSSLTVALSIGAIHHGNRRLAVAMIAITVVLGCSFLLVKYFEWGAKISHGIYPGSETLAIYPKGEILFFGLYFSMTGLHGLHVLVGVVLLTVMLFKVRRWRTSGTDLNGQSGPGRPAGFGQVENSALYWHLVDIIWIFLFPLFYLIT